jgi:hypothetical protein
LAVLGWVAFHSLPVAGRYFEKRLLRARLTEARSNPIEQLTQKHLERRDHVRRDKEALVVVAGQLIGMRDLVARQRASAPHTDLSQQTAALELMAGCHARLASRLRANELALTQERALLDEQRFKWDFSQAGKRVTRGLWDQDREQIVASLAEDEALRAVETNFAEVMAALEAESPPLQLPAPIPRSLKGGPS